MAQVNLGRVVGYSAYEVAVQNGYVGTEAQWLASLKGAKGDTGEPGEDGSIVSVSASGTATDEVGYITIDGVEKKLAGGSGEPNAYLKSAAVSSNTLTLTKKDNTTVVYTPDIPTKTSDLTNDSGFLTEHQSLASYRTSAAQDVIDAGKQDTLVAGSNISIAADGKTISATDTTYSAGSGISITDGVIASTVVPGTTVSGTNDGTNWQTITIDGTTKAIPAGGGSSISADNTTIINNNNVISTAIGGGGSTVITPAVDIATVAGPLADPTGYANISTTIVDSGSPTPAAGVKRILKIHIKDTNANVDEDREYELEWLNSGSTRKALLKPVDEYFNGAGYSSARKTFLYPTKTIDYISSYCQFTNVVLQVPPVVNYNKLNGNYVPIGDGLEITAGKVGLDGEALGVACDNGMNLYNTTPQTGFANKGNIVKAEYSAALGYNNTINSGQYNVAIGNNLYISKAQMVAIGRNNNSAWADALVVLAGGRKSDTNYKNALVVDKDSDTHISRLFLGCQASGQGGTEILPPYEVDFELWDGTDYANLEAAVLGKANVRLLLPENNVAQLSGYDTTNHEIVFTYHNAYQDQSNVIHFATSKYYVSASGIEFGSWEMTQQAPSPSWPNLKGIEVQNPIGTAIYTNNSLDVPFDQYNRYWVGGSEGVPTPEYSGALAAGDNVYIKVDWEEESNSFSGTLSETTIGESTALTFFPGQGCPFSQVIFFNQGGNHYDCELRIDEN